MKGPASSRAGEVIAKKYVLEELLGSGGMGEVYRATNKLIGRTVAIKLLRPEHARNETILNRFEREARAATLVRHVNVVDVLDMGRDDNGAPYIVQEFLEGMDLRSYMKARSGRLSIDDALDIMIPVCEAVGVAHARGVVHRDIKPGNIFIVEVGAKRLVKVLDFGVSQIIASTESRITQTGEAIGTPAYMSPEQIQNPKDVDARSDLWSLGVMLYELVAGVHPFTSGDSAPGGVFVRIATQDPTPLELAAPRVPHDLSRVVRRCLRRLPKERYPTALELARDLKLIKSGEAIDPTQKRSVPPPAIDPRSMSEDNVATVVTPPSTPVKEDEAPSLDLPPPKASGGPAAGVPDLELPAAVPSSQRVVAAAPAPPASSQRVPAAPPASQPSIPAMDAGAMAGVRMLGGGFDDDDDFEVQRGGQLAVVGGMSGTVPLGEHHRPMSSSIDLDDPRRSLGQVRHDVPKSVPRFDWSPFVAAVVCAVVLIAVDGVLWRFAHSQEGWRIASMVPSAFDGKSAATSGLVGLVALAGCLAASGFGLLRTPKRIGLVVAGAGLLVVAIVMIIVTFAALSPEAESADPPAIAKVAPYALPIAPAGLGLWLLALGFDRWREEGAGRKVLAVLLMLAAALGPFAAAELAVGAVG
jgi:serine/threonine-protein kinase